MSSGKTGQQKWAEQQAGSPIPGGSTGIQSRDLSTQQGLTGAAQGTLSQFEGPVQQSPFYKALLNTGIQSTSNAYQNADTNLKRNAQAAGFGYNQPVTQGAEDQLQSQEASALAAVPTQATEAAVQPALSAAGTTAGEAGTYGNQAVLYGAQALSANQQAAQLQAQRQAAQQSLWQSILGAGTGAFTAYENNN